MVEAAKGSSDPLTWGLPLERASLWPGLVEARGRAPEPSARMQRWFSLRASHSQGPPGSPAPCSRDTVPTDEQAAQHSNAKSHPPLPGQGSHLGPTRKEGKTTHRVVPTGDAPTHPPPLGETVPKFYRQAPDRNPCKRLSSPPRGTHPRPSRLTTCSGAPGARRHGAGAGPAGPRRSR